MTTPLEARIRILAELWVKHRDDENFADFFEYADVALPLSYILREGIVEVSDAATRLIDETFELLLAGLDVSDEGFGSLSQLLKP